MSMMQSPLASSEPFQVFLQKARSLDLGPIAHQLMYSRSGPQWSKPQTVRAIARYLAFLYLVNQYPHLQLVPTYEVDQVWHQHILDTAKYAEDCQRLFGQFIHHFPYLGTRGESDQHRWHRSYALTQVLLRQHFGSASVNPSAVIDEPSSDRPFPEVTDAQQCEPLRSACRFTEAAERQQRPTVDFTADDALLFFAIAGIAGDRR